MFLLRPGPVQPDERSVLAEFPAVGRVLTLQVDRQITSTQGVAVRWVVLVFAANGTHNGRVMQLNSFLFYFCGTTSDVAIESVTIHTARGCATIDMLEDLKLH